MVRFVTPGNVSELAEAVRELYEHPERRKQLSASAGLFTREYNWEKQKQTYYQLIDSLVLK
jgi:glycosyltransferase involved in cell wall biosynthesis